jgi:hypothetical protein|eukprot:COSAG06_NODE_4431_length_4275_cov_1.937021_5_plen_339_part_00
MRSSAIVVLLLGACLALSGQAAGAPIASPAKVGSSKNHSEPANHSGDGPANATCFLNQFRTLSPEEAEKQGINLKQQLAHKLSVGSVAFSVTLMVFGGAMLVAGWKLFTLVLFLSGFGGGFLVAFFAVSSFFNQFPALFNCWVLSLVPLIGGLVCGAIVRKTLKLAFFLVGASVGLVFGFYAYNLGLDRYEVHGGSVHWVYWGCLLVPALLCGSVSVKLESKILAFATSLVGGFAFVIGADFLILHPIDQRFTDWISPSSLAHGGDGIDQQHVHLDGFTLGPIIAALVLSLCGTLLQLRLQGGNSDEMSPMPYGGNTQSRGSSRNDAGYEEYKSNFWR